MAICRVSCNSSPFLSPWFLFIRSCNFSSALSVPAAQFLLTNTVSSQLSTHNLTSIARSEEVVRRYTIIKFLRAGFMKIAIRHRDAILWWTATGSRVELSSTKLMKRFNFTCNASGTTAGKELRTWMFMLSRHYSWNVITWVCVLCIS